MSKILNVNTGNYTIRVANGSTITFDTGATGTTALTGNLTVAGTQTTVNSQNLDITDNIIFLNKGETGGGITLKGATDKTWNWVDSTDSWTSSENFDLAS